VANDVIAIAGNASETRSEVDATNQALSALDSQVDIFTPSWHASGCAEPAAAVANQRKTNGFNDFLSKDGFFDGNI